MLINFNGNQLVLWLGDSIRSHGSTHIYNSQNRRIWAVGRAKANERGGIQMKQVSKKRSWSSRVFTPKKRHP